MAVESNENQNKSYGQQIFLVLVGVVAGIVPNLIIVTVLLMLCSLAGPSLAQSPTGAGSEEMKKLDFLVGQWTGEGWIAVGLGQRRKFKQTEGVQLKVDGALLLIDGLGKGKVPGKQDEVTVHSAFAVVSYDTKAKAFRWRAYRAGGDWVDTDAKVGDRNLEWGFHDERAGDIRFTIAVNQRGQWFEIGEYSRDAKTWQKFFEMTLDKQ
jgi:hypothetical protein